METPIQILIVEDSEPDAWLTGEELQSCGVVVNLTRMSEGNEALNALMKIGPFRNMVTPDLILLDLKIPGMDADRCAVAVDLLQIIKEQPSLKDIPVVILTSSAHENDIERTYRCNAIAYLEKPLKQEEITPILKNLHLFRPCRQQTAE